MTVRRVPVASISTSLGAADSQGMIQELRAALAGSAMRERFAHVHDTDEARAVLRDIIGAKADSANVSFQTNSQVIDASGTPAANAPAGVSNVADQLIKLEQLRDNGVITAAEFEAIKQKFLSG